MIKREATHQNADLQHFDIQNLERSVDWFNITSYDIHGSWDIDDRFAGPFVNSHTNFAEIQMGSRPPLAERYQPGYGDARERNLRPALYREEAVKAAAWDDQWVSFDDQVTWRLESNLARSQCISGVMEWAISQDDAEGTNIRQLTAAVGGGVMDYPEFVFCDACRDHQVHLGCRYTDRCLAPSEAFCCDRSTMEITLRDPPEEEDPFGGAQAEELRLLIRKYMRNPICPATILELNLHDIFTFVTIMLRNRSPSLNPSRAVWDDEFAGGLDDQYTSESLMDFFDLYPDYDSNSWLEHVPCNPYAAGTGMRIARGGSEILCELPWSTTAKRRHLRYCYLSDSAVILCI
ncbi:hypothetical protein DL767_010189 [Monosporascus sp. MG133]|nr:hypothetical protein DL767_010189 [Monosporascus sp. MG133]